MIWEKFGSEFFAPLHFKLFPGVKYWKKVTNFPMVISHFQKLMLAYAPLQEDLNQTIADDNLTPAQMHQVKELHFLLDYAIPTVGVESATHKIFVKYICATYFVQIYLYKSFFVLL